MGKLLHSEQQLLRDWSKEITQMFNDEMAYQVGTSLTANKSKTHRDVDIRIMLDTKAFWKLAKIVDINRLNLVISLYGQRVTGLPIDFQVQDQNYANEHHSAEQGKLRSAVGIGGVPHGDGYDKKKMESQRKERTDAKRS